MAETTQLELVTPARVMVSKGAEMVVVPGTEGLFGVLPRHSALLASLQRGGEHQKRHDKEESSKHFPSLGCPTMRPVCQRFGRGTLKISVTRV